MRAIAPNWLSEAATGVGAGWLHRRRPFRLYLKPFRLHHWLKNLLLFVPLLAAHRVFESALPIHALLAFLSFGCLASAGYVFNDLLDRDADQRHPSKRLRPFACGALSVSYGLASMAMLLVLALVLGSLVSADFLKVAAVYFAMSLSYSLLLKSIAILDVIILAGLYTIRVLAGSAAVGIWPSDWLLSFSTFLFFSLALVKRYGELMVMRKIDGDDAKARGYELSDAELLATMGVASGYLAVLVLALYINSDKAASLYGHSEAMWFLCPLMLYLVSHVWLVAHRGEMPDDLMLFATRDRTSMVLMALMLVVTGMAL